MKVSKAQDISHKRLHVSRGLDLGCNGVFNHILLIQMLCILNTGIAFTSTKK